MREITHCIYYDEPVGFLARISCRPKEDGGPERAERARHGRHSFLGRRGLEALIFSRRARALDTDPLEEQLDVLVRAECLFRGTGPASGPEPSRSGG